MKRTVLRLGGVWLATGVATAAFAAGFLLANRMYRRDRYLNSLEILRRLNFVTVGKMAPGTYYIPFGHGRKAVTCRVITNKHTGDLRELDILHGAKRENFTFIYQRKTNFGVPAASLLTGFPNVQCWIDVGLKGRFLIEGGSHGGARILLNGRWVRGGHLLGDALVYGGKKYRYDETTGGWDPLPTSTAPAGKIIAKGKAGIEQRGK